MKVPPSRSACWSLRVARPADEVGAGGGDLGEREPVGAADDRDERGRGRSRPPCRRWRSGSAGPPRRRSARSPPGGASAPRRRPSSARRRRSASSRPRAVSSTRRSRSSCARRHVRGHRDLEDRRLPGLGQPARDRLADRGERLDLGLGRQARPAPPHGCAAPPGRARRPRRRCGPPGPVPRISRELEPLLAGDPARERRRLDPAVGRRRLRPRRRLGLRRRPAASRPRSRSSSRAGAARAFLLGAPRPTSRRRSSGSGSLGSASGTSSPSSPMTAIVWPTGTSPSWTAIFSSTPDASASTSCVTFSVSSS